jgi:hypothetical protein
MNWPIRTSVLLFFSLITLFACDNSYNIGLDGVGTDVKLGTAYTDTITIKASTVLVQDSILAFRSGNTAFGHLLAGQVSNNTLGSVSARGFLEVSIASATIEGAAGATIDSMVLALDYDTYYGDTTQNLALKVHKLTQPFNEKVTYFANSSLTYDEAVIGSSSFKPTPTKKVKFIPAGSTTTIMRSFPARIRLNNNVASQILQQSGNAAEIIKVLPGIAITADNDAKAALGFNLDSDSTYLRIYYTSGATKRSFNLPIKSTNDYFTNLTTDRSTSALLNQLQKSGDSVASTSTNNQVFLQESVGLKAKITFPYLSKLKKELGDVGINRAELVIPVVNVPGSTPSPYLYLFETNKKNKFTRFNSAPRAVSGDGAIYPLSYGAPAPLIYDAKKNAYTLNITSYLQGMLYGARPNNGLIISPASLLYSTQSGFSVQQLLGVQTLRQTVLNMAPGNRVTLRIYYTTKE